MATKPLKKCQGGLAPRLEQQGLAYQYDNAGNLKGYQQVSDGTAITTRYDYTHNGGYLQTRSATTRGGTTAVSNTWRDANGFISNIAEPSFGDLRMNRAFVNDAQGNVLYVNQGAARTGRIQNQPVTVLGWKLVIEGIDWLCKTIKHKLDDNGLTSCIEIERRAGST